MTDRFVMTHKVKTAIRHPERIVTYVKRLVRTRRLLKESDGNFLKFYADIVDDDAAKINPNRAIGSHDDTHWAAVGQYQFEFLLKNSLEKSDRFLDIGCGNLRLGTHLINYLDPGCYFGVEISPKVLTSGIKKIDTALAHKLPHFYVIDRTDYSFLPEGYFDRVHAHSVFSHLPIDEIRKCLQQAKRIMKPGAKFDFTYHESMQGTGQVLNIDFYFSRDEMMKLVSECGFEPEFLNDWDYPQKKIRAHKL